MPSRACRTPHSISRAPSAASSTSALGSWRWASSIASASSPAWCDLGDPDRRAAACGFHEDRVAELAHAMGDAVGVAVPLPGGHGDRLHQRQAGGGQHHLHVGLVHADSAGEHPCADVADARHLEHPLDGAVLAPGPVQEREDDVDLAEGLRGLRGLVHDEVGDLGVPRERHRSAVAVDRGQLVGTGDLQPLGVAGLQHPAAVCRNADRHDVVLVTVDGVEHAAGGDTGDRVLVGPPTEDDGYALSPDSFDWDWLIGPDPSGLG